MNRYHLMLFLFFILVRCEPASAQTSDFLVLKKNGRAVKSLFAGSLTEFTTESGGYAGRIESVAHDSITLLQYDVRQMPTHLGVYILDTVAIYRSTFNYRDIIFMGRRSNKGFNWSGSGGSLMGGGILLTTIGLGTWIFTKPGTKYHAPTGLIIGAAGLGGLGYVIMKGGSGYKLGGKYTLEYVKTR